MIRLIHGDCLEKLKNLAENSIDSIVTDPPYGLSFMGKHWDKGVPDKEIWEACIRVLKPGGHLLAFAGTRTQHRMATKIEDAGFEIRDMIAWVYGSGFPKSHNIGKKIDGWNGWGTALKPALEPITVARKPLSEKTVAENVLKWGTGGINIDGCRTESLPRKTHGDYNKKGKSTEDNICSGSWREGFIDNKTQGRFPANFIHDGDQMVMDLFPETHGAGNKKETYCGTKKEQIYSGGWGGGRKNPDYHNDKGGSAARFFYSAKASKKERGEDNKHPTVKPIKLMSYLCRLVTPPNGIILDPFMGSGSTGVAAQSEGFQFIGIEKEWGYFRIANKRIYS